MVTSDAFRRTLGSVPTGVVVVTASDDGEPIAMVIGTFTSVSLDPPLVGFFASTSSSSCQRLLRSDYFAVNVLASHQEWLCRRMVKSAHERFADLAWEPDEHGNPLLEETVASITCRRSSVTKIGDHLFILGHVQTLRDNERHHPLVFHRGSYSSIADRDLLGD